MASSEGDEEVDTDTRLALLASLLEPISLPLDVLLEAIEEADGDVTKAAEALLIPKLNKAGKRKAGTNLQSWLKRPMGADSPKKSKHAEVASSRAAVDVNCDDTVSGVEPLAGPSKPAKSTVDLLGVLRQAQSASPTISKPKNGPQPPVVLGTQAAIDCHSLPLTLLESPLPASLASALYLAMMQESESWEANKFYLAGKWVVSPHTTTNYKRAGGGYGGADGARYFYSGTELAEPKDYIPLLDRAASLVERAVNDSLQERSRHSLEWGGQWKANFCGANRYDGAKSTVGWHADQLSYLGPYTTIASLSLGTPRAFRLRQTDPVDASFATSTKPIRTYEVNLGHNSLCLMNAGCQERFKHTVPPQKALDLFRPTYDMDEKPIPSVEQKPCTSRINITFRFYREDFHPCPGTGPLGRPREGTPICKCGIPALLRADQKAKARSRLIPISPSKRGRTVARDDLVDDDMLFFWQCQSPGQTGDIKGCGFFRILDMTKEGRGPCIGDECCVIGGR